MERVKWIDNARVIGILLIITGHTIGVTFGRTIFYAIYIVNVSIFFFLSGYLHRQKPIQKVISGGFDNLLLPYIITSVLMIIFSMIAVKRPNHFLQPYFPTFRQGVIAACYGIGTATTVIGKTQVNIMAIGAIWFLPCMFVANLLYTGLRNLTDRYHFSDLACTVLFAGFCTLGFVLTEKFNLYLPWSIPAALVSMFFYWTGEWMHRHKLIQKGKWFHVAFALIVWGLSARISTFWLNTATADNPAIAVIGSVAGCYAICYVSLWLEKCFKEFTKWFSKLGELSLIVLCTHILDLNTLKTFRVMDKLCGALKISSMKFYTTGLILCRVVLAVIAIAVIPHIPVIRSFFMYRQYPLIKKDKQRA